MNTPSKKSPLWIIIAVALVLLIALILLISGAFSGAPQQPSQTTRQTESTDVPTTQEATSVTETEAVISPTELTAETTTQTDETDPQPTVNKGEKDPKPTVNNDDKDPKPTTGNEETEPTSSPTEPATEPDTPVEPPHDLPPSVTIPPETDPSTGEVTGIAFPCQIPGYDLVIEKLAPYSGMFVEDGSNRAVSNVAMLLVRNDGSYPIEYTQIAVQYEGQTLQFDISALPAGERLVVQETTGKAVPASVALSANALVVQRAQLEMSQQVRVTDNGDNTLTVENLTQDTIPTIRVFYKYYMEDEDIFVGGIAFSVRITRLAAGSSVVIQPSHYTSDTSCLVMVQTYDN